MSRIARIAIAGVPYHVTQRGNGRQRVFFDDTDYVLYLDLLREKTAKAKLTVWAWCLMPNHVHLVVVPQRSESMARGLGRAHAEYARHFNLRQRSCGHVWQARFFSCPLDHAHLWQAMAYVECNPVRAGLVERAEAYPWSSAAGHVGASDPWNVLALAEWNRCWTVQEWGDILRDGAEDGASIRAATYGGRPLGSEEFVVRLERYLDRRLRPGAPGRPRKQMAKAAGSG